MTLPASPELLQESGLYENLRRVISVVDELRDAGLQQYVNLPRIAVVGGQSSGKSSVLESIVGADFLPRGDGVVTRRPLELRLIHTPPPVSSPTYAVFATDPSKRYTSFPDVKAEIERQTEVVAGKNKGIVDDPIVLTIYSSTCPDLTLIDLPGITRVPVKGSDQTENIEQITKNMAMRYIQDPRTIILAVVAANQDMSTSDALQMSRLVDPTGVRTIGVITKIDIMDPGTDARKMLLNEEVHLRLGYVGVKNRGQQDIRDQVKVKEALDKEKRWFMEHGKYGDLMEKSMLGTEALVDKLTKILFTHIKAVLPQIKKEIADRKKKVAERLSVLGDGVPEDVSEQTQMIWQLVSDYSDMLKNQIKGKYDRRLAAYGTGSSAGGSSGGAQIRQMLNTYLAEYDGMRITGDLSDEDIDTAIRMHEGDSLPGFPSPDIFEYLILPYLKKLEDPSVECLTQVSGALEALADRTAKVVFRRFPRLADQVVDLTNNCVARLRDRTKTVIEEIIQAETGYLFTNDRWYLDQYAGILRPSQHQQQAQSAPAVGVAAAGAAAAPNTTLQTATPPPTATGGRGYVQEMRARLDAYFAVVLRNVRDAIPKSIGFFLVRAIQDKLQYELYHALNKSEILSALLGEPDSIRAERKALQKQLAVLENSSNVLSKDPAIVALQVDNLGIDEEVKKTVAPSAPGVQSATRQSASQPSSAGGGGGGLFGPVTRQVKAAASSLFDNTSSLPSTRRMPNNPLFE